MKELKLLLSIKEKGKHLVCSAEVSKDTNNSKDLDVYAQGLLKKFEKLMFLNKKDFSENLVSLKDSKDITQIANNISANLNIQIFEKQELLEIKDLKRKLEKINTIIDKETSMLSVEKKLEEESKIKWKKLKEEYYLNEQLKAIQKELGEIDEGKDEVTSIAKAINKAKMPKFAREKCLSELKKLKSMALCLQKQL